MRTVHTEVISRETSVPGMVMAMRRFSTPNGLQTQRFSRASRQGRLSAGVLLAVVCIATSLLLQSCGKREEKFYPSLADAAKAGEITRGWLPGFIPGSSHNLHLLYDPSSPRTFAAFDFAPNDAQGLTDKLTVVDQLPSSVRHISPPKLSWWPDFLKGDIRLTKLRGRALGVYVAREPDVHEKTRTVLFVIDRSNSHAFFYRAPAE